MRTKSEKNFQILAHIVMIVLSAAAVVPFILMVISSLTDNDTLISDGYSFTPAKWSAYAYEYIFNTGNSVVHAYGISVVLTIAGTICVLMLTTLLAYAISKKGLPGKGIITFFVVFTMLFNGGLVPTYMLPLTKPIVATIALFVGIAYWNDWMNGYIYITKRTDLYSVQNLLNRMMQNIQYLSQNSSNIQQAGVGLNAIPTASVRMAMATVGVLPILVTYPFIQKYFVKGITLGGIKG